MNFIKPAGIRTPGETQRDRFRLQLHSAFLEAARFGCGFGCETQAEPKTLDRRARPRRFGPVWPDGGSPDGLAVIAYRTREANAD